MDEEAFQIMARKRIVSSLPGMENGLVRNDIPFKIEDDLGFVSGLSLAGQSMACALTREEFVQLAIAGNVPITCMNHPEGLHGFDILNDDERSCKIIRATLEFIKTHLSPRPGEDLSSGRG